WTAGDGSIERRGKDSDMGGTMRLGSQDCHLAEGSKARELYGQETIKERHRHRYEFNNNYLEILKNAGLVISGLSADRLLVEMIEIPDHPWFVACQFHPEFTSTPRDGHPLFEGFVKAAMDQAAREADSRDIA
ncbi:MAG: gamma-glutamyl-gamma-aminobutyrate hydrolase family protein, partial [Pseudomonadales bacterium]